MAISYRASTTFTAGNYTSVAAHGKPAGTAIGDVVVASMYIEATGLSPVIASTGDTWTLVHEITNTTPTPDFTHYVWVGVIGNASSTVGVTWGGGSFWADFTLTGFPGVDNTTPQDAAATENSGTSTTPTALGIAEVTADSWLVMCTTNFAGNASSGSTLTERHDNENVAVFAAASSSSANQTATITSSNWTAIMLRLRPAPATTTRFYLPASGTAGASPTISADWEHSSGIRRPMSTTKGTTALATQVYTPDGADHLVNGDALHVQFVSPPLQAQTISAQTVTLTVQCLEANAANNLFGTWKVFVWTAAGAVGSTLVPITRGTLEVGTAIQNRSGAVTSTSVTVGDGDRLVLEAGLGGTPTAAGGTQGHNGSLRFGETGATDAPANDTSTSATENPWLEFANVLLFQPQTTGAAGLRARAQATAPSMARRALVTWVSLSVPGTNDLAAAAAARVRATATTTPQKDGGGAAAARAATRGSTVVTSASTATAAARIATRGAVVGVAALTKDSTATVAARVAARGVADGSQGYSQAAALRTGARAVTTVTSASTATAALAVSAHVRAGLTADLVAVTDTFTRSDNPSNLGTADSGQVWSALVGTWGISGNKAVILASGATYNHAVVESGLADASIQVTLDTSMAPSSQYGIAFRTQSAGNGLFLRIRPGVSQVILAKLVGGVATTLVPGFATPDGVTVLRVECSGTTVKCYVDGVLVIEAIDSVTEYLTETKHGLVSLGLSSVTWDDFSVTARAEGPGKASTTTLGIRAVARAANEASAFVEPGDTGATLRARASLLATAGARVRVAVAAARSRISAALVSTAPRVSASAGRTSLRLQAPSSTRTSLTTTAARTTAGGQSTGEAYVPKASLGVVTIGGTAAAATPTTLTDRLGLADLFGTASVTTLIAPRVALGEAHLQAALHAQSDGLAEYTLYWPPAERLQPVHLGWTYRGDTIVLPVWQAIDQRGNLLNLEGATVWFTAKADLADTDAEPLTIQCSTLIGGVVIIDPVLGSYQVTIPPVETQQLADDTVFTFDVQVQTVAPSTHTVRRGTLGVVQDVTRSGA